MFRGGGGVCPLRASVVAVAVCAYQVEESTLAPACSSGRHRRRGVVGRWREKRGGGKGVRTGGSRSEAISAGKEEDRVRIIYRGGKREREQAGERASLQLCLRYRLKAVCAVCLSSSFGKRKLPLRTGEEESASEPGPPKNTLASQAELS